MIILKAKANNELSPSEIFPIMFTNPLSQTLYTLYIDEVVALFDTLDFLLNEYFNELNTANFNILNKFFNWIVSKKITNE